MQRYARFTHNYKKCMITRKKLVHYAYMQSLHTEKFAIMQKKARKMGKKKFEKCIRYAAIIQMACISADFGVGNTPIRVTG